MGWRPRRAHQATKRALLACQVEAYVHVQRLGCQLPPWRRGAARRSQLSIPGAPPSGAATSTSATTGMIETEDMVTSLLPAPVPRPLRKPAQHRKVRHRRAAGGRADSSRVQSSRVQRSRSHRRRVRGSRRPPYGRRPRHSRMPRNGPQRPEPTLALAMTRHRRTYQAPGSCESSEADTSALSGRASWRGGSWRSKASARRRLHVSTGRSASRSASGNSASRAHLSLSTMAGRRWTASPIFSSRRRPTICRRTSLSSRSTR
mmetsp:Transcript_76287/g.220361  ORF Transcript_76287/g.220361 Transcript_76287/m.220361 type:complete len:261 (+) Transcript_76287:77-859(+)